MPKGDFTASFVSSGVTEPLSLSKHVLIGKLQLAKGTNKKMSRLAHIYPASPAAVAGQKVSIGTLPISQHPNRRSKGLAGILASTREQKINT